MTVRFNVPPGWPTPPLSWTPSEDWLPDPQWPEPPEGWSFWSPMLEGAGSLSVADRAALEAELDGAESGSYGCTVVTWWSAAGEVRAEDVAGPVVVPVAAPVVASVVGPAAEAESEGSPDEAGWVVPVPVAEPTVVVPLPATPSASRPPADAVRAAKTPRRTATIPRRNLLVAAVIVCALGLVGLQASRILLVSDDSDGTGEVPKPLPVSDTRVPTRSTSASSEARAPSVVTTTASTDRPDLVAATVVVPSSTSAPTTAPATVPATTRPTTAATSPRTTAPATTKRAAATPSPSRSSTTSASNTTTPATRLSVTATKTVVAATATAAAAGGDRS